MTFDRDQLVADLKNSVMNLVFIKADGSRREMRATLQESALPPSPATAGIRKVNADLVHVWDLDKNQWRSVRLDRLQSAMKAQA